MCFDRIRQMVLEFAVSKRRRFTLGQAARVIPANPVEVLYVINQLINDGDLIREKSPVLKSSPIYALSAS